ncbi:Cupredoxin [Corynascus similis CBS 632.67]
MAICTSPSATGHRAFFTKAAHSPNSIKRQRMSVFAASASTIVTGALFLLPQRPVRMDAQSNGSPATAKIDQLKPPLNSVRISPVLRGQQDAAADSDLYETVDQDCSEIISHFPQEAAVLTTAPHVPPPITRDYPVVLKVSLTTSTKLVQLTSQYKYEQWTFNGTVPGPFIRARVGDIVDLTLTNRDHATGNPHNIDCHAFTGPGGGAALTTTEEGETKTARFRLLHPGLYLYHCAAAPVPVHIANGMYGLMYVQPAGSGDSSNLPPADREYYVMQSEFYHEPPEVGDDGRPAQTVEFSYPGGLVGEAGVSAVVFNGRESATTRDAPLRARTGETVRLFFGNAGPNLASSLHVIGACFRRAYRDGDVLSPPARCVSTLAVPPGGAAIVDLKMVVPGTYTLVDHAIFRLDKGAVGFLNVSGKPRPDIYGSSEPPAPCAGCKLHS